MPSFTDALHDEVCWSSPSGAQSEDLCNFHLNGFILRDASLRDAHRRDISIRDFLQLASSQAQGFISNRDFQCSSLSLAARHPRLLRKQRSQKKRPCIHSVHPHAA